MHNRFKQIALGDKLLYVKKRQVEEKRQEYENLIRKIKQPVAKDESSINLSDSI